MLENRIFIDKDEVLDNFLNICNQIKETNNFIASFFGFYFEDECMNVDFTDDYYRIDDIINYIKIRSFDDLIYYYFDYNICFRKRNVFIYSNSYELKHMNSYNAVRVLNHNLDELFDYNSHIYDILYKIDSKWYDSYNYGNL
jgi:hypothetical protein